MAEPYCADIGILAMGEEKPLEEKFDMLLNHVILQNEFSRWQMHNIGVDNFSEGNLHEFTQPIYGNIEDVENGLNTKLLVTAEGLQTEISNAVTGLEHEITVSAEGLLSTVSDTYDTKTSVNSKIQQSKDSILLQVSGTYATGAQVTSAVNVGIGELELKVTNDSTDHYSKIKLYNGGALISTSGEITLGGDVVFISNLQDGKTTISGDNILTGSIYANEVSVTGAFRVYDEDDGSTCGYMGAGYGSTTGGELTYGVELSRNSRYYLLVTNAGVRMQAGDTDFYCSSGHIVASRVIEEPSDRRIKTDINYDIGKYEAFFRALKPCYYKRIDEEEGSYHTGYIAQEVEEALIEGELANTGFAALVKYPLDENDIDGEQGYRLAYSEFIPLNTAMIQRLYERVEELEAQVALLTHQ